MYTQDSFLKNFKLKNILSITQYNMYCRARNPAGAHVPVHQGPGLRGHLRELWEDGALAPQLQGYKENTSTSKKKHLYFSIIIIVLYNSDF